MIILSIETSCDETAAAVLKNDKNNRVTILSNIVASSADLQSKYGGVIPEQAAREQIKSIIPVIQEALDQAFPNNTPYTIHHIPPIDAIAVTYGPGLIGSLLVGVETAKVLATIWNKPLIPVNHLLGHFYANWITPPVIQSERSSRRNLNSAKIATLRQAQTFGSEAQARRGELARNDNFSIPKFPCIGLLISGGHTDLVLFKGHGRYTYLGGTRDDAAGECFDKCARLLNLSYPGGPAISKLAESGNPESFDLPRPMINSKDFDFSFSGLKTSVSNIVSGISENNKPFTMNHKQNLAASIEQAIIDVLINKTTRVAQTHHIDQIIVAGGVAANKKLVSDLKLKIRNLELEIELHIPPPAFCTDNAAMIAAAAFFNNHPIKPNELQANPNLNLSL